MSLNVRVITPEKIFLTSETEQVILPSVTGGIGILKGHAPLVTVLEPGIMRYSNSGSWTPAILYGGFAEVENNQVTVLVNGAEEILSSPDLEQAEKAFINASEKFEKLKETVSEERKLKPALLEVQIAKARLDAIELIKK